MQQVANTDDFLMSFFLSQNRIMMDVELEVNESKLATARVRLCLVLASAEPNQVQFIIQICLKAMFFFRHHCERQHKTTKLFTVQYVGYILLYAISRLWYSRACHLGQDKEVGQIL